MNIKFALASVASLLLPGIAFAQIGNPFATLGIDFYGFFLPWIFSFAIVYGLLLKVNVFGGDNNRISAALAFVVAFFVAGVGGPQLALFFTNLFGGTAVFLAGILVIILFTALLNRPILQNTAAFVVVIILGILLFLFSSGQFVSVQVFGPELAGLVFWLIVIIVAVYLVMQEKKEQPPGKRPGE